MQTVNLLTIEWQLKVTQRVKHLSLYCLSNIITYKEIFKKILSFLKNQVQNLPLMPDIGQVCRRPLFQNTDLSPFQK